VPVNQPINVRRPDLLFLIGVTCIVVRFEKVLIFRD
jgi:hypothetical protein